MIQLIHYDFDITISGDTTVIKNLGSDFKTKRGLIEFTNSVNEMKKDDKLKESYNELALESVKAEVESGNCPEWYSPTHWL